MVRGCVGVYPDLPYRRILRIGSWVAEMMPCFFAYGVGATTGEGGGVDILTSLPPGAGVNGSTGECTEGVLKALSLEEAILKDEGSGSVCSLNYRIRADNIIDVPHTD